LPENKLIQAEKALTEIKLNNFFIPLFDLQKTVQAFFYLIDSISFKPKLNLKIRIYG
jgi:hypothetical protein